LQLFQELRYTGHIVVDAEKITASPERIAPLLLAIQLGADYHATGKFRNGRRQGSGPW
jgi:hypothetical protein